MTETEGGIRYEVADDGVATLTIDRPQHHNLLTPAMVGGLRRALSQVRRDSSVGALVLTGRGRTFCPGVSPEPGPPRAAAALPIEATLPHLLYTTPVPTVAAVHGGCAGVGLGLACACDFRLGTEQAVFRSAFLSVGLAGDMGLPWLLTRLVGPGPARRICLLDERIPAAEALRLGLVDQIVSEDQLLPAATALARRLAAGPPLATRAVKAHLLAAERLAFDDFLELEFQRHFVLGSTDYFRERWQTMAEHHRPRNPEGHA